jgi:acetyl esterase/lipase
MASDELQRVIVCQRTLAEIAGSAATVEDARRATRDFLLGVYDAPLPTDVVVEDVDAHGVPARWLRPPGADVGHVILYFHGGGYMMGSIDEGQETIARIARSSGATVLAINYRLAPENPFPAAVDDAEAAYRWLLSIGTDPSCVVAVGDSAGGGLTMALLLRARNAGVPLPAAAVLLSPFADLAASGGTFETNAGRDPIVTRQLVEFMAMAYVQGGDVKDPFVSPLYGDLTGLPPLLIQVGGAEALLADAGGLADNARRAGVDVTFEPWEDMLHTWQFYPWLPEARQATARIAAYIRQHAGDRASESSQVRKIAR